MSTVDRRRSGGGKQRGKATIVNKERRERDDTPQQQQQQQQQQQPQPTAQSSSSALSTSSVEELRAALSAVPSQTGYLILDHQATTLAVRTHNEECSYTSLIPPIMLVYLLTRFSLCHYISAVWRSVLRRPCLHIRLCSSLPSTAARRPRSARPYTRPRQRTVAISHSRLRHIPLHHHRHTALHSRHTRLTACSSRHTQHSKCRRGGGQCT